MKFENLYNLKSFDDKRETIAKHIKDAAGGLVLERNLEYVDPAIFEKKFPSLAFMNSGVQVSNVGGYAEYVTSLRRVPEGTFRSGKDKSSDKGVVSFKVEDSQLQVEERVTEGNWSDDEVKQAAMQDINVVSQYMSSVNDIYMREIDKACLVGIGTIGSGLLNYSGYTVAGGSTVTDSSTADSDYGQFATLINAQRNAVNNTDGYMADTIIMPIRVMNIIGTKILNSAASPDSVLVALQKNFPQIKFMSSFRCEKAIVPNSGTATSSTVCFSSNRDSMVARIPVPLMLSEIERKHFQFSFAAKYRIAGLDVLENTAGQIRSGL